MSETRETREWTLMFYFASSNPLAPGVVTQLKALKDAGAHPDVNVIAYFKPEPDGTPVHIFDVNSMRKLEDPGHRIRFSDNDPFVRDLLEDRLWGGEKSRDGNTTIRDLLIQSLAPKTYNLPAPPPFETPQSQAANGQPPGMPPALAANAHPPGNDTSSGPRKYLETFLNFCADNYPAKHYMLFILGHGLVVGDDVFLYDEHAANHSLTLSDLGEVLYNFKTETLSEAEFELVSFHSCSMSGLEVAYELQGTAKYMLASQGPAYVGSWPYNQILTRVFNDIQNGQASDVEETIRRIFYYVLYNSTDFILAGYSFDLCLCDLRKITAVQGAIKALSDALINGLLDPMVTNCVLLAHWQSQSYWSENYTDLYDFCFCLSRYCDQFKQATHTQDPYQSIINTCVGVMDILKKQDRQYPANPVFRAEYAGPDAQYSHGLSVFFPWTRPAGDAQIMQQYENYKFNSATGWFKFLDKYWGPKNYDQLADGSALSVEGSTMLVKGSTMRPPSQDEMKDDQRGDSVSLDTDQKLREDMISVMFNTSGVLSNSGALDDTVKPVVRDPTGDACSCGSIKNYLRDTRKQKGKPKDKKPPVPTPASKAVIDQNRQVAD